MQFQPQKLSFQEKLIRLKLEISVYFILDVV